MQREDHIITVLSVGQRVPHLRLLRGWVGTGADTAVPGLWTAISVRSHRADNLRTLARHPAGSPHVSLRLGRQILRSRGTVGAWTWCDVPPVTERP